MFDAPTLFGYEYLYYITFYYETQLAFVINCSCYKSNDECILQISWAGEP